MLGRIAASLALAVIVAGLWVGGQAAGQGGGDPVLVGAGDIASCSSAGDEATAALLDGIAGTVATFGDNAYPNGSAADFDRCYDPSWGRFKERTKPSPGNHEYHTAGASGYFNYFGGAAGDPLGGYYSYDLGSWHVIVLSSTGAAGGGCGAGAAQERSLRSDLEANPRACTVPYFRNSRFSSSVEHGNSPEMTPFWEALYEAGADVVLSGHSHNYERFAPQTPSGQADAAQGIRQFVVGTGGRSHYSFGVVQANSEVRIADADGVIELTLHPEGYDWQFLTAPAGMVADAGNARCHGAPSNTTGIITTGDTGTTAATTTSTAGTTSST